MPTQKSSPGGDNAAVDEVSHRTGPEVIAGYLKTLPASPGVYRMLDRHGEVIYVGKARSLKARVANYTRLNGHTNRIARMILATATMEFVTVRTEAEALLLEANLIKRFRPRFNVLLRDDKSFPFILIARDHRAPQILKHRGARNRKGDYFGPFASAGAVSRTINMLQRAFLLRSCNDSVYESRTRPCLLWQIKRCSAPCTGEISLEDYEKLVDEAVRFLRGESQNVRQMYQSMMQEASDQLEYELAAKYRNRLWALAHVTSDQSINAAGIEEADIFAAHQEGGQTCVQVFFFRTGQNWGNRAYYPKADRSLDIEEIMESFIAQFYDDKPVPRLILVSHDFAERELLAEALSTKAERKVEVAAPKRGAKADLVAHARSNAKDALGRRLAETSSQRELLKGLAERFALDTMPTRIEVFDNSHISGTHAVGAMIVAGPEGFAKSQYRKFNIKSETLTPGDDYAMMREVLTRRFRRLVDPANANTAITDEIARGTDQMPAEARPAVDETSRIRAPDPMPLGERGANSLAFASLRASDPTRSEAVPDSENQLAPAEGPSDSEDQPASETDPFGSKATRPQAAPAEGPSESEELPASESEDQPASETEPFGSKATRPQAAPAEGPSESEELPASETEPFGSKATRPQAAPEESPSESEDQPASETEPFGSKATRPQAAPAEGPSESEDLPASETDPFGSKATRPQAAPAEGPSESEELPASEKKIPDLVLIDGGAGQLAVAREVLAELGLHDIALIGVAKGPDRDAGREHFHKPGAGASIMLEPRDPVLYFIQRLRDEAHRFAIGTHRAKRAKAFSANPLDEIPGIGPMRRRALLTHFGSAKAVSRAGIEDLKEIQGISAEMAQKIYDFFHDRHN